MAVDLGLQVGADVVARAVLGFEDDVLVARHVAAVVGRVLGEGEGSPGGAGAHAAGGAHPRAQGVDGLHLAQRQAHALGAVFVGAERAQRAVVMSAGCVCLVVHCEAVLIELWPTGPGCACYPNDRVISGRQM